MPSLNVGNYLFAGAGTNLTNGVFFPGTAFCDSKGCEMTGPPLQIDKGTNVIFINLDPAAITNGHRIMSLKHKKGRRRKPLFFSEQVDGPGKTILRTSKVKPGLYYYRCTTHFGMYGAIEVTKPHQIHNNQTPAKVPDYK